MLNADRTFQRILCRTDFADPKDHWGNGFSGFPFRRGERFRPGKAEFNMMKNEKPKKEKLLATVLFWSLVIPAAFAAFFRLFFLFFNFIYGFLIVKIIGQEYAGPVTVIAGITSLGFTIGVLVWLYRQFKKHILSTF